MWLVEQIVESKAWMHFVFDLLGLEGFHIIMLQILRCCFSVLHFSKTEIFNTFWPSAQTKGTSK